MFVKNMIEIENKQLEYTVKKLAECDFGKKYIDRIYMVPEECSPFSYFILFFEGDVSPLAEESCLFCKNANDIVGKASQDDTFKECEISPINSPDYDEWKDKVVLIWER